MGRLGVHDLFPKLGATLGDEAWEVCRAAGAALAGAGPIGAMLLRVHLDSEDRFARDMARQMLDVVAAREGGALDAVAPIDVSDEAPLAELWAS